MFPCVSVVKSRPSKLCKYLILNFWTFFKGVFWWTIFDENILVEKHSVENCRWQIFGGKYSVETCCLGDQTFNMADRGRYLQLIHWKEMYLFWAFKIGFWAKWQWNCYFRGNFGKHVFCVEPLAFTAGYQFWSEISLKCAVLFADGFKE